MNLDEFYNQLTNHDWYYDFSDDSRVYNDGRFNEARLKAVAKIGGDRFVAMFEAFKAHAFSGPAFGTEKAPKPEAPKAVA